MTHTTPKSVTAPNRPSRFRITLSAALALCGCLALLVFPRAADAQLGNISSLSENVEIESLQTSFDQATRVASAEGEVHIKYGDAEIFANRAEFHESTGDIHAKGGVTIYKGGQVFKGETIIYNIRTGQITASDLRSSVGGIYFDAGEMTADTEVFDVINTADTMFTTHDSSHPNYRIKAKKIDVYPDDKVVFKNVTVYAGKVPVFWLPYLSQPMDDELGYQLTPGYQSSWGAFFLNQYGTLIGDHTLAKFRLDYRTTRGIAGGVDLFSQAHRENPNIGKLILYGASDQEPTKSVTSEIRPENMSKERYRISFQHRIYLGPEDSGAYVDFDINKFKDRYVLEDFYPFEYRNNPRPDNIINGVLNRPRGELTALYRFRANDFYTTDSRSPEIALDLVRQPIFNSGVFYTSQTSFGRLKESMADYRKREGEAEIKSLETNIADYESSLDSDDEDAGLGTVVDPMSEVYDPAFDPDEARTMIDGLRLAIADDKFNRFHTYHEILYPFQIGGWLNVVPRGGIAYTNYSSVSGGADNSARSRTLGHVGVETSFKVSKVYDNAYSPKLGVDKLRHTIQPYANWSYLGGDDLPVGFPAVDRYAPTRRLRPIDVPLFTAVDELRQWNIIRPGVINRLQTQRDGNPYTWLQLNTYFESYMKDPAFDRDFSNLFADLAFSPLPWLRLNVESQFPVFGDALDYTDVNSTVTFMPVRWHEFAISHRYISDHPFFENSSLLSFRTYTRLGENWGIQTFHRYEFDDSTLEWQQYSLHRDLQSWTASIGAMVRDNRDDEDEIGFVFTLSLKEFPQVGLPVTIFPGGGDGR